MPVRAKRRYRNLQERASAAFQGVSLMLLSIVAFIVLLWVVMTVVRVVVG